MGNLGSLYAELQDFDNAKKNSEEAEKIASRLKILRDEQKLLIDIGFIEEARGQSGAAEESYKHALQLASNLGDKETAARCLQNLTELTLQQILAGNSSLYIFPLCVLFVFLVLAAQYESWSLPLAIILIVPMCLFAAISGVLFRSMDNNIFTQIGFVVLVGLACKNAILIVEFAKQQMDAGHDRMDAAVEAARLRLRPILMTSFAFTLGVLPLVVAVGPGAEMRQAIGTAVFSGMIGVTLFGIFLTPVFFSVIMKLFGYKSGEQRVPVEEVPIGQK